MAIFDPKLEEKALVSTKGTKNKTKKHLVICALSLSAVLAGILTVGFSLTSQSYTVEPVASPVPNVVVDRPETDEITRLDPLSTTVGVSSGELKAEDVDETKASPVDTNTGSENADGSVDTFVPEQVTQKCLVSTATVKADLNGTLSNGSGVVIDAEGHLITNYHVVNGATTITVKLNNAEYGAWVVGTDPSSDLAVLQLDTGGNAVTPIEIGNSDDLKIGQWVMAIGSPFGLEQSVSVGIVSSLSRSTMVDGYDGKNIYSNLIQTDAAINPGSSGGALINAKGQLVGINSIMTSYDDSFSGVGFAIPVNYAMGIANSIIAGYVPEHACLGVNTQSSTISTSNGSYIGAFVDTVFENTTAAYAGLQYGDLIMQVNGQAIDSAEALTLAIHSMNPYTHADLVVLRGVDVLNVSVELGTDGGNAFCEA